MVHLITIANFIVKSLKWRFQKSNIIFRLCLSLVLMLPVMSDYTVDCSNLQLGQFVCDSPTIDIDTQQIVNCTSNNTVSVQCKLNEGLICLDTGSKYFFRSKHCPYTTGYSFETALILAIFLGMFGADRFYLGYPAIGLLKLATLGGCFVFQLIDILLIAMQLLRPADNSHYVMKYFGPKLTIIKTPADFQQISEEFIQYLSNNS